jgi:hypothetical protein
VGVIQLDGHLQFTKVSFRVCVYSLQCEGPVQQSHPKSLRIHKGLREAIRRMLPAPQPDVLCSRHGRGCRTSAPPLPQSISPHLA